MSSFKLYLYSPYLDNNSSNLNGILIGRQFYQNDDINQNYLVRTDGGTSLFAGIEAYNSDNNKYISISLNQTDKIDYHEDCFSNFDIKNKDIYNDCFSYDEQLNLMPNAEETLSFKMTKYYLKDGVQEINPFSNNMHIGSLIKLIDKDNIEHIFSITDKSYNISNANVEISFSCQDFFHFQLSKQNAGYEIENDPSKDNFIGAKNIEEWTEKIVKECKIPYKYVSLNKQLFLIQDCSNEMLKGTYCYKAQDGQLYNLNDELITLPSDNSTNLSKIRRGINNEDADYYARICFQLSSSTAANAIISLAQQYGLIIEVDYKTRSFWYKDAKNPEFTGLSYSPNVDLQSLNVSEKADSLSTVFAINGPKVGDKTVSLISTIPQFFKQLFKTKIWNIGEYYPGMYEDLIKNYTYHHEWTAEDMYYKTIESYEELPTTRIIEVGTNKVYKYKNNYFTFTYDNATGRFGYSIVEPTIAALELEDNALFKVKSGTIQRYAQINNEGNDFIFYHAVKLDNVAGAPNYETVGIGKNSIIGYTTAPDDKLHSLIVSNYTEEELENSLFIAGKMLEPVTTDRFTSGVKIKEFIKRTETVQGTEIRRNTGSTTTKWGVNVHSDVQSYVTKKLFKSELWIHCGVYQLYRKQNNKYVNPIMETYNLDTPYYNLSWGSSDLKTNRYDLIENRTTYENYYVKPISGGWQAISDLSDEDYLELLNSYSEIYYDIESEKWQEHPIMYAPGDPINPESKIYVLAPQRYSRWVNYKSTFLDETKYILIDQNLLEANVKSFTPVGSNIYLEYHRNPTAEEIEFAKNVDYVPYLENKLIRSDYLQKVFSPEVYQAWRNKIYNNLRIKNSALLLEQQKYYQAIADAAQTNADIANVIDLLEANFAADIVNNTKWQSSSSSVTLEDYLLWCYTNHHLQDSITSVKNVIASQQTIVNKKDKLTSVGRNFFNYYQDFCKNIYNFRNYWNGPCMYSTVRQTNGEYYLQHNKETNDKQIIQYVQEIVVELNQYWSNAYTASLLCGYFLPKNWMPMVAETNVNISTYNLFTVINEDGSISDKWVPNIQWQTIDGNSIIPVPSFEYQGDGTPYAEWSTEYNPSWLLDLTHNTDECEKWTCKTSEAVQGIYYYATSGGVMWKDFFDVSEDGAFFKKVVEWNEDTWSEANLSILSENKDLFGGWYEMQYMIVAAQKDFDDSEYQSLLEDNRQIWKELAQDYGMLMLETSYTSSTATTPAELLNEAMQYYKDYEKPQVSYSLSVLDISRVKGYKTDHICIGDQIALMSTDFYYEQDNLKQLLQERLFIKQISYKLRDDTDISYTVETVSYQDRMINKLINLIK